MSFESEADQGQPNTSSARKALVGDGRYQWSAGGWFGSMLGSCAWMIVVACFLVVYDQPILASVPAIGFATVMIASLILWLRRSRIHAFSAMMGMFSFLAVVLPTVWLVVQSFANPTSLAAMHWPASRWSIVFVYLLVPAVMIQVFIMERAAIKRNLQSRHNDL